MTLPTLPPPDEDKPVARHDRPVALAAVIGGGVAMVSVVVSLAVLGIHSEGTNDVAMTGLASIGSTLAGGFAGWIAHGYVRQERDPNGRSDP